MSRFELVGGVAGAATEFIKRDVAGKARSSLRPVDKQGGLKAEQSAVWPSIRAAGIAPESVDSGAIIIAGSAKTATPRPAVMTLSRSR
ncbi:ethanolamine ammonia-lyase reactivating factor EutA [Salmonella enterica subsp. enterica]|nr:ethanolamine ammonia-lyase reactivating factor EutA [Salmonella enterica subsp. enterica]